MPETASLHSLGLRVRTNLSKQLRRLGLRVSSILNPKPKASVGILYYITTTIKEPPQKIV